MARSRETKIELTAYDDLFQTDESREEAKLSKIRDIPISEIAMRFYCSFQANDLFLLFPHLLSQSFV